MSEKSTIGKEGLIGGCEPVTGLDEKNSTHKDW